jgi:Clp amino terminal domain, pathogenicity island component
MSSPDELKSTPRYDRIVATSRQIAWDLGHTYVGVEHLFLAIMQDPRRGAHPSPQEVCPSGAGWCCRP